MDLMVPEGTRRKVHILVSPTRALGVIGSVIVVLKDQWTPMSRVRDE